MFYNTLTAIVLGYVIDLIVGDPHGMWHPICFVGNMISFFEKIYRKLFPSSKRGERLAGLMLVISVLIISGIIPWAILLLAYHVFKPLGFIIQTYMCYTILATKCLKDESMKVKEALERSLENGRYAVSMIVGRDTASLTEEGVIKATVETIAENTSDGVIAPMIYMMIGGPVLGYIYKAVNTMDSMVGYKNERYMYLGTVAARLDDVLNFIPARICALLMIVCTPMADLDIFNAWRIFRRDRKKHASPNSAQTESVMAGALHVELAGDAVYFGELHEKPYLGNHDRDIEAYDIVRANKLMYVTSGLMMIIGLVIRLLIIIAIH